MHKNLSIQNFVASLLLAVSLLSALPKSVFHDVVANHTDTLSCPYNDCVHAEGFHCGFVDQVVTAPYEPTPVFAVSVVQTRSSVTESFFPFIHLPRRTNTTDPRGPPSFA